jgi:hypothetical protein
LSPLDDFTRVRSLERIRSLERFSSAMSSRTSISGTLEISSPPARPLAYSKNSPMTIPQDQLSNSSVARRKERGFMARYFGIGEEDVKNAMPKSRWPYLYTISSRPHTLLAQGLIH